MTKREALRCLFIVVTFVNINMVMNALLSLRARGSVTTLERFVVATLATFMISYLLFWRHL
jgi:hypothetical protein